MFKNPDGRALDCDGVKVMGTVLLRNRFEAKGEVRLAAAEIGGDFTWGGSFRQCGAKSAINMTIARIRGRLWLCLPQSPLDDTPITMRVRSIFMTPMWRGNDAR